MNMNMNIIVIVCILLVIFGALNWGWLAFSSTNAVSWANARTLNNSCVERIFYAIIGAAGIILIFPLYKSLRKGKSTK